VAHDVNPNKKIDKRNVVFILNEIMNRFLGIG
jgi:hypothetical protein